VPEYKTTYTIEEPEIPGGTHSIIIFSDTYDGLSNVNTATEVSVFEVESSTEALEGDAGVVQVNNISFLVDGLRAYNQDDRDAIDFVLTARDEDTLIYCARFILYGPGPYTIVNSDFAFRGRVGTDFSWDDPPKWEGDLYSSDPAPVRTWKGEAFTIDLGTMLNETVGEIVSRLRFGVDENGDILYGEPETEDYTNWIATNVDDRQAYYLSEGVVGSAPALAAKWANLVSLEDAFQMLFDNTKLNALTLTFVPTTLDMQAIPARFHAIREFDDHGKAYRYVHSTESYNLLGVPFHYKGDSAKLGFETTNPAITSPGIYQLKTGGAGYGVMSVAYRLLHPFRGDDDPDVNFSWWNLTVAEVLVRVAYSLGCTLEFIYTSLNTVDVQFNPRALKGTVETFIRDAYSAKGSTKPYSVDSQGKYVGASFRLATDGAEYYRHTKDGLESTFNHRTQQRSEPKQSDRYLPLTISPTFCLFDDDTGKDIFSKILAEGIGAKVYGRNMHDVLPNPMLPHNIVMHEGATTEAMGRGANADGVGAWKSQNLEGVHTGIYITCPGLPSIRYPSLPGNLGGSYPWGEVGVDGVDIYAPVSICAIDYKTPNGTVIKKLFYQLSEYLSEVYENDKKYYEGAYTFNVPGLSGFRLAPGGTDSWKNIRAGNLVTLDGVEWIVNRVVRKLTETEITLHALEQYSGFVMSTIDPDTEEPPTPGNTFAEVPLDEERKQAVNPSVQLRPVDDEYIPLMLVSELTDGEATVSQATSAHYGRVRGMNITEYDVELSQETNTLSILAGGTLNVGVAIVTALGLQPGDRLYLRNGTDPVNWSNVPPDGSDPDEDLVYEFGRVNPDGLSIRIEPKEYRRFI